MIWRTFSIPSPVRAAEKWWTGIKCGAKNVSKSMEPKAFNSSHTDHFHGCYTLCNYEGAVRQVIIQLKYGGRIDRKRAFPPLLARFPYWDRLSFCHYVIPVPLSKKKWHSRAITRWT